MFRMIISNIHTPPHFIAGRLLQPLTCDHLLPGFLFLSLNSVTPPVVLQSQPFVVSFMSSLPLKFTKDP